MKHTAKESAVQKDWCTCGTYYMCPGAQWLLDSVDRSEHQGHVMRARLLAMILCAHRRIEIKRITRYYNQRTVMPYYGTYLKRKNRINQHAPISERSD